MCCGVSEPSRCACALLLPPQDPFPSWPRRGLPLFPGAEKLVRTGESLGVQGAGTTSACLCNDRRKQRPLQPAWCNFVPTQGNPPCCVLAFAQPASPAGRGGAHRRGKVANVLPTGPCLCFGWRAPACATQRAIPHTHAPWWLGDNLTNVAQMRTRTAPTASSWRCSNGLAATMTGRRPRRRRAVATRAAARSARRRQLCR